ncbi:MAG: hypothetical protein BGO34_18795 [Bacteroidia bacterium 44-10]|nr:MAG: hypothetical protein BGO34_18795 [Bacteroidia bacterium 44-10]
MAYKDDILIKLEDPNKWPGFERPEFLDELNELADSSFEKKTIEGYLASVLIYHQLTEELIRILIESSTFYIQLRVFPQEFQDRKLKKKMFGQLIQELNQSILDEKIHIFVEKAINLNSLRIEIVHRLTTSETIKKVKKQCEKVQIIFNEIWELFDEIYDNYRVTYKDFKKDIDELRELL